MRLESVSKFPSLDKTTMQPFCVFILFQKSILDPSFFFKGRGLYLGAFNNHVCEALFCGIHAHRGITIIGACVIKNCKITLIRDI